MLRCIAHVAWIFVMVLLACTNASKPWTEQTGEPFYFTCKIEADEEYGYVNIWVQLKNGDEGGEVMILQPPGQVMLDDERLLLDSARLSGAFYEIRKSIEDFSGRHTLVFTDNNGRQHSETFEWSPLLLDLDLSGTISRSALDLPLRGVDERDSLRVNLIDTSFRTPDINDAFLVQNGRIQVGAGDLRKVANGPVTLELHKEREQKIGDTSAIRGIIQSVYSLRREFDLVD